MGFAERDSLSERYRFALGPRMAPPELIKEVDQLATLNEPLSLPLTSKPSPLSLFASRVAHWKPSPRSISHRWSQKEEMIRLRSLSSLL